MKVPQFQIAWIMVAVALIAIDFTAIRSLYDSPPGELLILGALPMANVLAVCLLISRRQRQNLPFLLGFVTFGAVALAIYVALTGLFGHGSNNLYLYLLDSYLDPVVLPLEEYRGQFNGFVFIPILCVVYVIMLFLPQAAFGLLGGSISRRFKITITRRRETPSDA